MSFNIHHGAGVDGRLDLRRIADVVKTARVDVLALQEVDRHWSERSEFVDQAAWLADALDMHAVYGANLDRDPVEAGQPRRQYGTAILSAVPILDSENISLPKYEGHEQRGLLRARIVVRGTVAQIYNTHLQHNDAAERLEQAQAIKQLIAERDEPAILLGDLNALPDAPEIRTLLEGLVDTWEAGGSGEGWTYPSQAPDRRIDYILTSADIGTRSATVVTSDGSDHLPVRAEVLLPGAGGGQRS
nr:endonuclease/exonuclease/phosphatase family protein [Amycolatopsis palatopharyngis]